MISRRGFLTAGAVTASAAAGAVTANALQPEAGPTEIGSAKVSPHSKHQAGIALELQAHARFIAFDVPAKTQKSDLAKWAEVVRQSGAQID